MSDHGRFVAVDQADHFGAGVCAADTEVFELSCVAEGDRSSGIDDVVSHLPHVRAVRGDRDGLRNEAVRKRWRCPSECSMRARHTVTVTGLVTGETVTPTCSPTSLMRVLPLSPRSITAGV